MSKPDSMIRDPGSTKSACISALPNFSCCRRTHLGPA